MRDSRLAARQTTRLLALATAAAGLLTGWSCADDLTLGHTHDRLDGEVWRLTYNPGDDRTPRWLPGGDTLIYSANTSGIDRGRPRIRGSADLPDPQLIPFGLPTGEGVLLALHPRGGVARPFLAAAHDSAGEPLTAIAAAAVTRDGNRLAYVAPVFSEPVELACSAVWASCTEPGESYRPTPILAGLELHLRNRVSGEAFLEDHGIHVPVHGVEWLPDPDGRPGVQRVVVSISPYHVAVRSEALLLLGPSWAPAGDRVVFSDGSQLRIWTPGEAQAPAIPGTDGGVSPAWSPDGEWIAYTELVGSEPDGPHLCELRAGLTGGSPLSCVTEHWYQRVVDRRLRLTAPDGGASLDLGPGLDPAWSADGRTLYYVRDGQIRARDLAAGTEHTIAETERGREPAPSPDGRFLAFSRQVDATAGKPAQGYAIWISRLQR